MLLAILIYAVPAIGIIYWLRWRAALSRSVFWWRDEQGVDDTISPYVAAVAWPLALPIGIVALVVLGTCRAIERLARWHAGHRDHVPTAAAPTTADYQRGFDDGVRHARREMRP